MSEQTAEATYCQPAISYSKSHQIVVAVDKGSSLIDFSQQATVGETNACNNL